MRKFQSSSFGPGTWMTSGVKKEEAEGDVGGKRQRALRSLAQRKRKTVGEGPKTVAEPGLVKTRSSTKGQSKTTTERMKEENSVGGEREKSKSPQNRGQGGK